MNAICPQSRQHLLDKVQRLKALLNGQVVVTTDRKVSTKEHSMATEYCINELTEKIVVCLCSLIASLSHDPHVIHCSVKVKHKCHPSLRQHLLWQP